MGLFGALGMVIGLYRQHRDAEYDAGRMVLRWSALGLVAGVLIVVLSAVV